MQHQSIAGPIDIPLSKKMR
jgi:hypothetical protein